MMTSIGKQQLYGEYINPTIDQYFSDKENPLVLLAQVCNNIGKELTFPSPSSSSSSALLTKQRKVTSSSEEKKSLKRTVASSNSILPPTKKVATSQSSIFDSLLSQQLNKTLSSPVFDFSLLSAIPYNYSAFAPTFQPTPYLMDSILSSPFVCSWINSIHSDGFTGQHLTNHFPIEHPSITTTIKPFYYPSTD